MSVSGEPAAAKGEAFTNETDALPKSGRLGDKHIAIIKVAAPLLFIVICILIAGIMTNSAIKNHNYIDGKFILSGNDSSNYLDIESDGEYTFVSNGVSQSGRWSLNGGAITFVSSSGGSFSGKFINRKYIALRDESFLAGEIPDGEFIEAEVVSADGVSYGFETDGKFYKKEDGRYVEIGSYITDSCFIVITTEKGNITYLNCKDGITASFYQAS